MHILAILHQVLHSFYTSYSLANNIAIGDCLTTYPPDPLPLLREGGRLPRVGKRGVKPLSINLFPLSFEGEGDKRGEVSKHSIIECKTGQSTGNWTVTFTTYMM